MLPWLEQYEGNRGLHGPPLAKSYMKASPNSITEDNNSERVGQADLLIFVGSLVVFYS
jgi:hypothetical protein